MDERKYISLELAEEIDKAAREKNIELPKSEYHWGNTVGQEDQSCWRIEKKINDDMMEYIPAYDLYELGKMLPSWTRCSKNGNSWNVFILGQNCNITSNSELHVKGKILLHVINLQI